MFNNRYSLSRAARRVYDVRTGNITWPAKPAMKLSIPYHTRYGGTSCTSTVYLPTVANLALALHRQLCCRLPAQPGACAQLYAAQSTHLPRVAAPLERHARSGYTEYSAYTDSVTEELTHYADAHPKRAARITAHILALQTGTQIPGPRVTRGRVVAGFKIELAKIGKVPRIVVDIGVEASLVGAWLAKTIKAAQSTHPYKSASLHAHFIPAATYADLKRGFDILRQPTVKYTAIVFSDDACLAVCTPNGVKWYNLDISSCDKSHGPEVFASLKRSVPPEFRHEVEYLYQQLRTKLLIRNPRDPRQKFYITPRHITLYSGSVLTTCVNTHAVFIIALAIAAADATTTQEIIAAAASVGYIVTCEPATRFEEVQFLKHSPAQDVNGEWQPLMNLGVFLRSAGHVYGDLPHTGHHTLNQRAALQHAAHLKCSWPNTSFPYLDEARTRYPITTQRNVDLHMKHNMHRAPGEWPELVFTTASTLQRYGLEHADTTAIRNILAGPLMHLHTGNSVDVVLLKDYGLTTNDTHTRLPPPPAPWLPPTTV